MYIIITVYICIWDKDQMAFFIFLLINAIEYFV